MTSFAARASAHTSTADLAQELGVDFSPSALVEVDAHALTAMVEHVRRSQEFFKFKRFAWDDPTYWYPEGTPAERSQYFAVGNAINFRFWRLMRGEVVPAGGAIEGKRLFGAMYMWRCLRRCLDTGRYPLFDASFLANISEVEFRAIFADDTGINQLSVGLDDRLANLWELGRKLEEDWAGQFYNVVKSAEGSLLSFIRASANFRAFDDPLLKLTMVNTILHLGSGITEFNADPLPGIDYHLLKQMLRHGIVIPNPAISRKLEQQRFLTETEGFELRRLALNTFIEISRRTGISGEILDNRWWWNRVKCRTVDPVCLDPATAHECPLLVACAQHTGLGMPLEETRYY